MWCPSYINMKTEQFSYNYPTSYLISYFSPMCLVLGTHFQKKQGNWHRSRQDTQSMRRRLLIWLTVIQLWLAFERWENSMRLNILNFLRCLLVYLLLVHTVESTFANSSDSQLERNQNYWVVNFSCWWWLFQLVGLLFGACTSLECQRYHSKTPMD